MGIVQNKHLWFTHILYMNDSSEYTYALDLIDKELKEEYEIKIDTLGYRTHISSFFEEVPFTFSLSEEKDLLSQWRGYCPNGRFSVSFNGENSGEDLQLNKMMKRYELYIGKCVYEEAEQKKFIRKYIVEMEPEECKQRFKEMEPQPGLNPEDISKWEATSSKARGAKAAEKYLFIHKMMDRIIKYAPLFKHPSFREEREWRIVSTRSNNRKLRQGKSFLVPYLDLLLCDVDEHVKIEEVVVGPTPHAELARNSCTMLLKQFKAETKTTESEIPYRNW
ncbi:DUF2971 domain-containing protein [soil metagenome]